MADRLALDQPVIRKGWTNTLLPLRDYLGDEDLRRALMLLLGAVGAVLLIACANVANLALVRGSGRTRELAVRLSLGASRSRLIQQLATEGALLAGIGVAAGLALAVPIMKGLVAIAPDGTPFLDQVHLNLRVMAVAAASGLVAAIVSGLLPALSGSVVRLGAVLREGSAGSGVSRAAIRLRHGLVVAEVAAAVVLVTGAALLVRSFDRLSHVDAGVTLDRVISGRLSIPTARYTDAGKRSDFARRIVDALDADPAVESAAITSFVPAGGGGFNLGRAFLAEGRPEPPAGADVPAQWNVITPDYFRTVGIPVLAGRPFDARDTATSTPVMIVGESFAKRMFAGESPLGRRVRSWRDENVYREVVGVVADVKYTGLADRGNPLIYVPHPQDSWGSVLIVARARQGDPAALAPVLRRVVNGLDPNMAVAETRSLAESARRSVASQRYAMLLLTLLAVIALGLSALGIYGVTSHVFALRHREMGIRLALGASRNDLYRLVLTHGVGLAAIGLGLGVVGSIAATTVVQSLLFATSPADAMAWTAMVVVVLGSSCVASLLPARRAAGADPTGALRAE
jgi:putative ABC transport system permease protein